MTIEYFISLEESDQKEILVDADKVGEYFDGWCRYELFKLDNFYVEVKVSFLQRYRIIVNTYLLSEVPLVYSGKVYEALDSYLSLPAS